MASIFSLSRETRENFISISAVFFLKAGAFGNYIGNNKKTDRESGQFFSKSILRAFVMAWLRTSSLLPAK